MMGAASPADRANPFGPCLIRVALSCVLVVSDGCAMPPSAPIEIPSTGGQSEEQTESELLDKLRAEISGAPCDDTTQCRTLLMGAKACGGPEYWLPWSTLVSHADRLQVLSDAYASLQIQRVRSRGGVNSNCQWLDDPGAVCQARHCELRSRNAND